MKIYINGIDNGQGKVNKGKRFVEVRYKSYPRPVYYAITQCLFTTRFGKKCMIYGGNYTEQEIEGINKQYHKYMTTK